jgi:hypothetical protein
VRLYLDGVLDHVWTPEIVERIIGSRCALQHIVTDWCSRRTPATSSSGPGPGTLAGSPRRFG